MKKVLLATAIIISGGFFISANAGTHNNTDRPIKKQLHKEKREERKEIRLHSVNVLTEDQFHYDFPNAEDVSWTESNFAEATFLDDGIAKTAYYDNDNQLVGTTTHVDISALPEKAQKSIEKRYPGYSVEKVILFDDNEDNSTDMYLFGNTFEDKDVYFPILTKGKKEVILQVTTDGQVSFFKDYK